MDHVQARHKLMESYGDVIKRHREWLTAYGRARQERWEGMLESQPEAALVEGGVCGFLQESVSSVESNEDPDSGGPDFACMQGGERFYVEATCITIDAATRATGVNAGQCGARYYRAITGVIRNEVSNKAKQCAGVTDGPCLLAIGTLHSEVGRLFRDERQVPSVLTSDTKITCAFDPTTGEAVGESWLSTDLSRSAFIMKSKSDGELVAPVRRTISGILLVDLYWKPLNVLGVLHVDAARPFDRQLLPNVKFYRLRGGYASGEFEGEWV